MGLSISEGLSIAGGTGLGAVPFAIRSTDSNPAVFTTTGARDTYYTTTAPGDLSGELAAGREAVGIGPTDGSTVGVTAAFIRNTDNTDWVAIATNFVGSTGPAGAQGPTGPQGPAGELMTDVVITADLTINTGNIATYRNTNVVNESTTAPVTVTLGSISSFLTANPSDEFVIRFINSSTDDDMMITPAFANTFAAKAGAIELDRGQSVEIKLPSSGNRWIVLNDVTTTTSGIPPAQPQTIPAGNVVFKGNWDPTGGTFPAGATQGEIYEITADGTVDSVSFNQGDFIIGVAPIPSTTNFSGNWEIISGSDDVHTWAGMTGIITDDEIVAVLNRLNYDRNGALQWNFSTSVVDTDPGSTNVALNNALKASATQVNFNVTTALSPLRVDELLANLVVGDRIFIWGSDSSAKYAVYRVTALPVQATDRVPVTVVHERSAGAEFNNAEVLNIQFFLMGSRGTGTTPGPSETFYHGLSSSNNPASVVLGTLSSQAVGTGSGQEFTFSVGPATLNDFLILLVPADHDITTLINTDSGFSVINSFTKTNNVRVISTVSYHSYVLGPLVANFTANYRATLA